MIIITSPEQFTAAAKKASQVKPHVEFVKLGHYTVWGQGGDYTVKFAKVNGKFSGECNCKAGENNRVCYHLFCGYLSHRIQVGIRRQVKASQATSVSNWITQELFAA